MKKIIGLIAIIIFVIGSAVISEELPSAANGLKSDLSMNPVYHAYIKEYAEQLKNAFEKEKIRFNHQGTGYEYTVDRDGKIIEIKNFLPQNKWFNEKVKKVIINNPPPPFREGMDLDHMKYHVFYGNENYEEFIYKYYYLGTEFYIKIIKKY